MLTRSGKFSLLDIYRFPIAVILWPLVALNYYERRRGLSPDEWYWADAIMFHFGYYVI
jgi:hypothetical protein